MNPNDKPWQEKVTLTREGGKFVANNPTPYFVTVTKADFKNKNQTASYTADAVMLAPFSQQTLNKFQLTFQPDQMSYTIINDLGGNQTFEVK